MQKHPNFIKLESSWKDFCDNCCGRWYKQRSSFVWF